jgi:hypothetical protein
MSGNCKNDEHRFFIPVNPECILRCREVSPFQFFLYGMKTVLCCLGNENNCNYYSMKKQFIKNKATIF